MESFRGEQQYAATLITSSSIKIKNFEWSKFLFVIMALVDVDQALIETSLGKKQWGAHRITREYPGMESPHSDSQH